MKLLSETTALVRLNSIRTAFAEQIRTQYEHRAKSCASCETPGACCLDAHFVNVCITRLEAVAIRKRLAAIDPSLSSRVKERIDSAIERFSLTEKDGAFYACPLYEKGIGCLVHDEGKPLPCVAHACYERKEDLPPDELLAEQEAAVDKLNRQTYRNNYAILPLPLALKRYAFREIDQTPGIRRSS